MSRRIERREFVVLLGGAAGAWPLAARAQQSQGVRRIGVLGGTAANDIDAIARIRVTVETLRQLGWTEGHNVQIDVRQSAGDAGQGRKYAAELVALAPDVILAIGSVSAGQLLQETRTVPIVFVIVPDPMSAGFVDSLARPGGNATGFMMFEYGLAGKWLELLKQIAPNVTQAGVLRDSAIPAGVGQFAIIQSVASSVGVDVRPIGLQDQGVIERGIAAFAQSANGGLILTASALSVVHRDLIILLAARYKLPAVYYERYYVVGGGLISYGPSLIEEHRRAAGYIDRILRGAKPADLPVQAPTKYELVINLKTAKALGLDVPPTLPARADEVIE